MQKRALKTKEKILITARKLFSKHGFHGTSVDLIAEKAEANKQRIYAYFGNKAKLFEACLVSAFSDVSAKESRLRELTEKDLPEMTRIILEHYIKLHKLYPDFWRLLSWANIEQGSFQESLKSVKEETFRHLKDLYFKGRKKGIFHEDVSFEVYIFVLVSVSLVYYSNRKTLSHTLSPALFTEEGSVKLVKETASLLSLKSSSC